MSFCPRAMPGVCAVLFLFACVQPAIAQAKHIINRDISLPPGSTTPSVIPTVPPLLNDEQFEFTLQNVSPLESCKLTGTAFAPVPPASALQAALTGVAGLGAFGLGVPTTPANSNHSTQEEGPPLAGLNSTFKEALDVFNAEYAQFQSQAQLLAAYQLSRQQDNAAFQGMYATFLTKDYRGQTPLFDTDFKLLSDGMTALLATWLPGEQPASPPAGTASGSAPADLSQQAPAQGTGRLIPSISDLYTDIPFSRPYANAATIVDLQAQVDQLKIQLSTLHKTYDTPAATDVDIANALLALDKNQSVVTQVIAQIAANDKTLQTQQGLLPPIQAKLAQLHRDAYDANGWKVIAVLPVPRARDGKLSGNITCVSRLDATRVTLDPTPYTVNYSRVPLLLFSTGILFNPLGKQTIGVATVKSGVDATGTDTTRSQVAITDSSRFQVVPFSFLSLRLGPGRTFGRLRKVGVAGVSAGFGVNSNAGTKDPEFFTGLFAGLDRFLLHAGVDFGRTQTLAGGFQLGEFVPSGTTVPTDQRVIRKLVGGISFRVAP